MASKKRRPKAKPPIVPAFIDPPAPDAPLAEWIQFRDALVKSGIPGIGRFVVDANRAIERRRKTER